MSKIAADVCDGAGAERVINTLLPIIEAGEASRSQV